MRAYVFIASALLACSAFLPWLAMRPMLGGEPILLSPWTFVEPMIDPPRRAIAFDSRSGQAVENAT